MLIRIHHLLSMPLLLGILGCGPSVSDEELGRVIFKVPEIPAGYEPYELPDLTASPGEQPESPDQPTELSAPAPEEAAEPSEPDAAPSDTTPSDASTPAEE